ncbi:MAG: hypothetical protein EBR82_33135 [Caulobacteraceae bacterium]|nr:hypothetical protein [Caulobacteraceae bacterium]
MHLLQGSQYKTKGNLMETLKQVSLTWFRAAAAAAIALYLAGETNLKVLGTAALAGFLGPVLKWLDPSAPEFGRGAE